MLRIPLVFEHAPVNRLPAFDRLRCKPAQKPSTNQVIGTNGKYMWGLTYIDTEETGVSMFSGKSFNGYELHLFD